MVSKKLWTNFDVENIRSKSFLIRTSKGRAPVYELVLLRGGLRSEIALQGGSLESKIVYRGVVQLRKTVNIFSAYNDRVTWNVEKTGFQKTMKNFWLRIFSVRVILDTYLEGQSSRFRARVAKRRPVFRDCITRGKPRVQNCVSRGRCRLRKTVNIFSAYNDRVT